MFFINLTIPRSIANKVSITLKSGKAFKTGLKYNQFPPPPDFVFTSERPLYSLVI